MSLPDDLYEAKIQVPQADGSVKHHPAGRLMVKDGHVHHLADYHEKMVSNAVPSGFLDDLTLSKLRNPGNGLVIASHKDIRNGRRPEFLKEADLPEMPPAPEVTPDLIAQHATAPPPSVWDYKRIGHDQPHTLQSHDGKFTIDGNAVQPDELGVILENLKNKTATLRYKKSESGILRLGHAFEEMKKGDGDNMDPQDALAHLHKLHENADPHTQKALASLRRQIFEDPMVGGGLGNKYAFEQHKLNPPPGVHVMGDANFFKQINDNHGHDVGDDAIKAMGGAWRDSANEVGEGKAHRFGGDEFHAHFPTHEHAANFARTLRSKLEGIPAIGGTHRLGMSLGIGGNIHDADKALYEAKKQKAGHTPSTVPHILAHSLTPGAEGPIAQDLPPPVPQLPPPPQPSTSTAGSNPPAPVPPPIVANTKSPVAAVPQNP